MRLISTLLLILASFCQPAIADYRSMTDLSNIESEAKRLKTAVNKIYKIGIEPYLTKEERAKIGRVEIKFLLPKADDYFLNFYAYEDNGRKVVVMPILSLKLLEDLTTAYAWIYEKGYSFSTIDLYFAMIRHRQKGQFLPGRYPNMLDALGVPRKAYELPGVDQLSLSLRNEAIAFILAHELGHIRYSHKGYDEITKAQARADEVQSDQFAIDVLSRTQTPPLGAVVFFQAQAYNMLHRGEFATEDEWVDYKNKEMTHPLSTQRLSALSKAIAGPLTRKRVDEKAIWQSIGLKLMQVTDILRDVMLQRCLVKLSRKAPLSILNPRKHIARKDMFRYCR